MGIELKEIVKEGPLRLKVISGEELLDHEMTRARIQKPGLLLTGMPGEFHPDRVQIFGAAEVEYLVSLSKGKREEALHLFATKPILVIIITRGIKPSTFLIEFSKARRIPLLKTALTSSIFIERLLLFLEEALAPSTSVHGVLVDVLGVGILILGKSGIGKSECALELVSRGYRLVADDIVIVRRMHPSILSGRSVDLSKYHIEVRGLGILNVKELYGITAIREKKQMDIVVELVRWDIGDKGGDKHERLGVKDKTYEMLDVKLPHLIVPVSPGRSVATIVEVAARNQILKIMGHDSARQFQEMHEKAIRDSVKDSKKGSA